MIHAFWFPLYLLDCLLAYLQLQRIQFGARQAPIWEKAHTHSLVTDANSERLSRRRRRRRRKFCHLLLSSSSQNFTHKTQNEFFNFLSRKISCIVTSFYFSLSLALSSQRNGSSYQCDQMAFIVFIICPFTTMTNCPIAYKFA